MSREQKRSYWKQLCRECRESGATMHEFCRSFPMLTRYAYTGSEFTTGPGQTNLKIRA